MSSRKVSRSSARSSGGSGAGEAEFEFHFSSRVRTRLSKGFFTAPDADITFCRLTFARNTALATDTGGRISRR